MINRLIVSEVPLQIYLTLRRVYRVIRLTDYHVQLNMLIGRGVATNVCKWESTIQVVAIQLK